MNEILQFAWNNPGQCLEWAMTVVAIAAVVTSATPTPKDDGVMSVVRKILDVLALNIGNAKNQKGGVSARLVGLLAAVSIAVILTAGCAGTGPGGSGGATQERMDAAAGYLLSTANTLQDAYATAREKQPDKAEALDAQVKPVLDELSTATAAYLAAVEESDASDAGEVWAWARPLVSTAVSIIAPYAIGALVN